MLSRFNRPNKSKRQALGVTDQVVDEDAVTDRLAALGADGVIAGRLDVAVADMMAGVISLSALSSPLALNYLERIQHPIASLDLGAGVFVVTRGYVGHLAVEAAPGDYGAVDIPVLGTLPPLRHGRPPGDLLTRAVRATKRGFVGIRAVNDAVWDGFVFATVWRVHDREQRDPGFAPSKKSKRGPVDPETGDEDPRHLDPLVVDGLVRLGWVLRQVDLHYGQEPERA